MTWIAKTIRELHDHRGPLEGTVGLVPTMGALHEGHLSLIEHARRAGEHVIVSIFVNPTQFGPGEDFQRYPRPVEEDLARCREAGVTGVFLPSVDQIYPPGVPDCEVSVPMLARDLEGALRPGHFGGVCRVVAKLFHLARPHLACFGQKDFQQLRIIQAMVEDLFLPIQIIECPTLREPDGLARSSRNVYLGEENRRHALGLYRALQEARLMVEESGESNPQAVEQAMSQVLRSHHIEPDYAVVRHPLTLAPLDCLEPELTGGVVALVAGRLGPVRLIDNMVLRGKGPGA